MSRICRNNCLTFQICFPRSLNFMSVHTFSMGFESGDCAGQSSTSTSFSYFHAVQRRLRYFGLLSSCSSQFSFFLINYLWADGNKAFWYILTILAAFKLSVKICKVPNLCFEKQPQTCTFTGCLTVRWMSLLVWVDQVWLIEERAQKEASSEKITLSQSRSKFSFAQASLFSTCFSDSSGFFTVLQNFTPWANKRLLIVSHDTFRPFLRKIACPPRNDRRGFFSNTRKITLSSVFVVFCTEPWSGKSSTFFYVEITFHSLIYKCLRLFHVFSSGSIRHFRSFRMQTQKHGFVTWCVRGTHCEICSSVTKVERHLRLSIQSVFGEGSRYLLWMKRTL